MHVLIPEFRKNKIERLVEKESLKITENVPELVMIQILRLKYLTKSQARFFLN